jgi:hypothetical protein
MNLTEPLQGQHLYGDISQDLNLEFNIINTYQFNRTFTGSFEFISYSKSQTPIVSYS